MKRVKKALVSLSLLTLAGLGGIGCQTTSLAARTAPEGKGQAMCEKNVNSRKDCQDQVGCFWDYQKGACVASH